MASSVKSKLMRTVLTLGDKLRAYNMISNGASVDDIVTKFHVSPRFVRKLRKEGHLLPKQNQVPKNVGESGYGINATSVFNTWVDVEDSAEGRFVLACSLVDEEEENE